MTLELSFGLPCYDARNPLQGRARFEFSHLETGAETTPERVVCALVGAEPEHYMEQTLVRWNRLRESSCGYLSESLEWRLALMVDAGDGGDVRTFGIVRLKEPVAFSNSETWKTVEGGAVSFEWKGTMTGFFG